MGQLLHCPCNTTLQTHWFAYGEVLLRKPRLPQMCLRFATQGKYAVDRQNGVKPQGAPTPCPTLIPSTVSALWSAHANPQGLQAGFEGPYVVKTTAGRCLCVGMQRFAGPKRVPGVPMRGAVAKADVVRSERSPPPAARRCWPSGLCLRVGWTRAPPHKNTSSQGPRGDAAARYPTLEKQFCHFLQSMRPSHTCTPADAAEVLHMSTKTSFWLTYPFGPHR